MDFDDTWGHVRSLCLGQPSMDALGKLGEVLGASWASHQERTSESLLPYVLDALASWPKALAIHEVPWNLSEPNPAMLDLLAAAFDAGVHIESDFVADYLMAHESRTADAFYSSYDDRNTRQTHTVSPYDHSFLSAYVMAYEHDPAAWERLYNRHVVQGRWKEMAVFGEVEPRHGLMPCELAFIERCSGVTFPQSVRQFYRLFGRLTEHRRGNSDLVINPYTYTNRRAEPVYNERYVMFLVENQGLWGWAYPRQASHDPPMILLYEHEDEDVPGILVDSDAGLGFGFAYATQTSFVEFVSTSRDPFHLDHTQRFGRTHAQETSFGATDPDGIPF